MRSHHKILIIVAALLAVGWLAWNALLVESEVSGVAADMPSAAPTVP